MSNKDGRANRQVVLILADGTRADVMQELLDAGDLPGIESLFASAKGGGIPRAVTAFPSTTGPAHLPFLTGLHPGRCNIPGIRWMDPHEFSRRPWSPFRFRSYIGPGNYLAARDLAPSVRTLFNDIADHASIAGNVRRGVRFSRDLTRWGKVFSNISSFVREDWRGLDSLVEKKMLEAYRRGTQFIFAAFYEADSTGHKFGPRHECTLQAYRNIDGGILKLSQALNDRDGGERPLVLLVSDHGMSSTGTHLDLSGLVDKTVGTCLSHPMIQHGLFNAKSAVMVSGNAMAHVYLKGERQWGEHHYLDAPTPQLARLTDELLARPEIDQVIGRHSRGGALVRSRRGTATIRHTDGRIEYSPAASDPFGYPAAVAGEHRDLELLRLTRDTSYPDAPAQILQILESSRCGHLVVTARLGSDLRSRYEKPMHRGSHGSLHAQHMLVPVLANQRLGHELHRTMDLHSLIARTLAA